MSAGKYWILVLLSLFIAILIFLDIGCEIEVTELTSSVSAGEARMSQAQQQNQMLRQLLQKIAVESQHDPALLDLLDKRGIHFSIKPGGMAAPAHATQPQQSASNGASLQAAPSAAPNPSLTP